MAENYNPSELLICLAARQMEDNASAFVGTGIPMLAAALAKKLYAPNLLAVFEFGGIGPTFEDLPLAVGGARTYYKALSALGIGDVMDMAACGLIEYGFVGGAQVDMYGNLNTTVIGDHDKPVVRMPGSGGANDIGSACWKTIYIMPQDKKKFVPKVDFITTPGYLTGPGAREKAGLPPGTGPYRVITNLCTIGFDDKTKWMKVLALNPGVTKQQVIDSTSFELLWSDPLGQNEPPTKDELRVLREEVDKDKLYI